ncbi:hypothetical protein [uncultured Desulfovibrio sp.]|uniref:hypothetical protein n=1 Tax=uncultured Desulfovibrio sp. TaxID=167968 RepID=UPI00260FDD80|nr:hypothetical protein [uncultured Desulfovibrio sp.]
MHNKHTLAPGKGPVICRSGHTAMPMRGCGQLLAEILQLHPRAQGEQGIDTLHLAESVLDMLTEYPWSDNVRELIHALERACLAAGQGDLILPGHLPTQMRVTVARHRVSRGREQSPESVPPPARDAARRT